MDIPSDTYRIINQYLENDDIHQLSNTCTASRKAFQEPILESEYEKLLYGKYNRSIHFKDYQVKSDSPLYHSFLKSCIVNNQVDVIDTIIKEGRFDDLYQESILRLAFDERRKEILVKLIKAKKPEDKSILDSLNIYSRNSKLLLDILLENPLIDYHIPKKLLQYKNEQILKLLEQGRTFLKEHVHETYIFRCSDIIIPEENIILYLKHVNVDDFRHDYANILTNYRYFKTFVKTVNLNQLKKINNWRNYKEQHDFSSPSFPNSSIAILKENANFYYKYVTGNNIKVTLTSFKSFAYLLDTSSLALTLNLFKEKKTFSTILNQIYTKSKSNHCVENEKYIRDIFFKNEKDEIDVVKFLDSTDLNNDEYNIAYTFLLNTSLKSNSPYINQFIDYCVNVSPIIYNLLTKYTECEKFLPDNLFKRLICSTNCDTKLLINLLKLTRSRKFLISNYPDNEMINEYIENECYDKLEIRLKQTSEFICSIKPSYFEVFIRSCIVNLIDSNPEKCVKVLNIFFENTPMKRKLKYNLRSIKSINNFNYLKVMMNFPDIFNLSIKRIKFDFDFNLDDIETVKEMMKITNTVHKKLEIYKSIKSLFKDCEKYTSSDIEMIKKINNKNFVFEYLMKNASIECIVKIIDLNFSADHYEFVSKYNRIDLIKYINEHADKPIDHFLEGLFKKNASVVLFSEVKKYYPKLEEIMFSVLERGVNNENFNNYSINFLLVDYMKNFSLEKKKDVIVRIVNNNFTHDQMRKTYLISQMIICEFEELSQYFFIRGTEKHVHINIHDNYNIVKKVLVLYQKIKEKTNDNISFVDNSGKYIDIFYYIGHQNKKPVLTKKIISIRNLLKILN